MTIGVTVHGLPTKGPSRCNALGVGSVTTVTVVTIDCRAILRAVWAILLGTRGGVMGRQHGERKADKARRCSRLVRPLGDRRRDMLQLHPAAAFLSPRAPGPRPACAVDLLVQPKR